MKCEKVRELLPEFLDSGVSERRRELIQAHLSRCQDCSDEWDLLVKTWNSAKGYPVPSASEDFATSVMTKINSLQEDVPDIDPRGIYLPYVAAAAAFLAVILTICLIKIDNSRNRPLSDDEIISDLTLYENMEMLQNLELLSDYEVIANIDKIR